MRIAALMPTRDRAATAARAISTFLPALRSVAPGVPLTLVVADDSSDRDERAALDRSIDDVSRGFPLVELAIDAVDDICAGGGPGAARNRGLAALRRSCPDATVTIMFDDDMCFADTAYRGRPLACDGARLIAEALASCGAGKVIAGCPYLGRQDLSILEHARLAACADDADQWHVAPAIERAAVDNVAPGGISTAFLAIAAAPGDLPDFPAHYNEDYLWLHALARAGWALRRGTRSLIHAPPGDVAVTAAGLGFQIHGEIVWLGVLESARFPVEDDSAMAAAVAEIAGDLRCALHDPAVIARPGVARIIADVAAHYDAIARAFACGRPNSDARDLRAAIRAGLTLAPARATDVGGGYTERSIAS